MENSIQNSINKVIFLSKEDESFLNSFRNNYNQIKSSSQFDNYCIKYYKIMKAARKPADVYIDSIILRREVTELNKKEQTYKTAITDIYTAIKLNLSTLFECSKKDYKHHFKSTMDSLTVTTNTILQMTNETTKLKINKQLNLFQEELKLIFKGNVVLMNKRFEEFRKAITNSINKNNRKSDDSSSTSQNDNKINKPNISLDTMSSINSGLSSSGQNSESENKSKDFFKKPVHPPFKGKTQTKTNIDDNSIKGNYESIKDISNHNFNVNEIMEKDNNEKVMHLDISQDEASFMKNVVNQSTKISRLQSGIHDEKKSTPPNSQLTELIMRDNLYKGPQVKDNMSSTSQKENTINTRNVSLDTQSSTSSGLYSSGQSSESENNSRDFFQKPVQPSFKIKAQTNNDNNIIKGNYESIKDISNHNLNVNEIMEKDNNEKVMHLDISQDEASFMKNVVNQSTKISRLQSCILIHDEKKSTPPNSLTELIIKGNLNKCVEADDWVLPSGNSFNANLHVQSTKVNHIEQKSLIQKKGLNEDLNEESFMKNVWYQSTKKSKNVNKFNNEFSDIIVESKKSNGNSSSEIKTNETIEILTGSFEDKLCVNIFRMGKVNQKVNSEFLESTLSPGSFNKNMPLAQSTYLPTKNINIMTKIEERSESSGSKGIDGAFSTANSPNEVPSIKTDCPKYSKIPKIDKDKYEGKEKVFNNIDAMTFDKENVDMTLKVSDQLDHIMEELKNYFRIELINMKQTSSSAQIDVITNIRLKQRYDRIINNPWEEKKRLDIWKTVLPKLLSLKSVTEDNGDLSTKFFFGTIDGIKEFTPKKKLQSTDKNEFYVVKSEEFANEFVIKIKQTKECLEFYYLKCVHRSEKCDSWKIDIEPSVCGAIGLHITNNKSYFLMPFYSKGDLRSLQTILHNRSIPLNEIELIVSYIAMELIATIYRIHTKVRLLHCNIKPENVLLNNSFPILESSDQFQFIKTGVIVLINFDRAIYLSKYPSNSGFIIDDKDLSNGCVETKSGKPWSYQLDLFNVATSLYLLLQNNYPHIIQFKGRKVFENIDNFILLKAGNVWLNLFNFLLNFDFKQYNNILGFLDIFQQLIRENIDDYNKRAHEINSLLDVAKIC